MKLTIQFRLTAWYFLSLAVIIVLFGVGSWLALQATIYSQIDRDLRYGMGAVVPFVQQHALHSREQFSSTLAHSADASIVGILVQITDDERNVLYESDVLLAHQVAVLPLANLDGSLSMTSIESTRWGVRAVSRRIVVDGVGLSIHVVEPLRDLMRSLRQYTFTLALFIPIALLLTAAAGYFISRRALVPVEQIRKHAEAIDPADLTARLPLPATDDELARLTHTLNAMLARIEAGFVAVRQFTADASHELRAPLSLIITAADVSLRRERSREEMSEALRKILGNARHMSRLVENLLSLARGDAGRGTTLAPVDLAGVLGELCAQITPVAQAKGLALLPHLPDHEVRVTGDDNDLRRLFLILLDNAIKYTEAGSITLALSTTASDAEVAITDTGIGIEPAGLPHVFDRFWRADKVRSRAEGGAGLGLSIAQQIVRRHDGTLTVKSDVGSGTTFTVRLSLVEPT